VNSSLIISQLCVRYLKYALVYYRANPKVMPAIKRKIHYLKTHYGRTLAVAFGPLALKSIRERMVEENLSRRYINDHVGRIKRMFKWAVGEEILPVESYQSLTVVEGLRKGRTSARECAPILPVDDAIVDLTLPHLPEVVADMVRLQRLTGNRPEEVCMLRPCDIDRSSEVWVYKLATHKTDYRGRKRLIFVGPQGQKVLLRYLARDPEANCFRPCDSESKRRAAHSARTTPESCGNRPGTNRKLKLKRRPGEKYTVDSYRRAIHRACDKAFVPDAALAQKNDESEAQWMERLTEAERIDLNKWQSKHRWSPNRLRHSAATEIHRLYGLEAAATVLGHAKADVTQIYAELDYGVAANVARQIG
jgi:integrase